MMSVLGEDRASSSMSSKSELLQPSLKRQNEEKDEEIKQNSLVGKYIAASSKRGKKNGDVATRSC
jgi:hypothetical protein